jgi:hypothetical protein
VKVGDSRKATLLTLVAIGAIGFMVIQLLPAGTHGGPTALRDSSPKETSVTGVAAPASLVTDPFSNGALARKSAEGSTGVEGSGNSGSDFGSRGPNRGPLAGDLSNKVPPMLPGAFPGSGIQPETGAQPVKNAGSDRQSGQEKSFTVELGAVLKVGERRAFLSLDGEDAKTYREGDSVAEGLVLKSIDGRGIVLVRRAKSFRILVGGLLKL